jgi:hypothetical protein
MCMFMFLDECLVLLLVSKDSYAKKEQPSPRN